MSFKLGDKVEYKVGSQVYEVIGYFGDYVGLMLAEAPYQRPFYADAASLCKVHERFTVEVRCPRRGETFWSEFYSDWVAAKDDRHVERPVQVPS